MIANLADNVEVFGDEVIRMPMLKELSGELLVECIDEQIEDPTSTKINFLETFKESYDEDLEEAHDDDDGVKEINDIANDFYCNVIDKINKKYQLGLDEDTIYSYGGSQLQNFADGLYQFFLINYQDNITTYFSKMIIAMKDALSDSIQKEKNSSDAVDSAMSRKIKSGAYATVLANINSAVKLIRSLEMDPMDFIKLFDEESFPVAVLKYGIKKGLINGNFVPTFVGPFYDRIQDDTYDEIMLNIQQSIYEEYKKEFQVDDTDDLDKDIKIKKEELVNKETEEDI